MPRVQPSILPEKQRKTVNCFAFVPGEKGKNPRCSALNAIYCLCEDKPCAFFATPQEAQRSRAKAAMRLLMKFGVTDRKAGTASGRKRKSDKVPD